ncbi:FHA domain-containing protein [Clostridium luticellarii]|uniref:FHA domain-containing protein FhaB n=1 Tax=Clostridium luticellarii TaxID=1691940 RepID=A0A2T0BR34_9CLOT|nr:FHA domain-containing protein [Clostridium luticellarii]MCI1944521.1 FHA domain-containing protein [Clostridium luticellarii]MCI1968020.1 FHA domain-containing protein [Clostridium luticellarii]MCI1995588.1 FHA domain-containing protein [Clostridium luticellarii]MCI2039922.1 FHA domain-containing protein [Clostridium luticellarii]PRR86344.1 FHA domain-containing protein FhaB [Clostridium luticellarii]
MDLSRLSMIFKIVIIGIVYIIIFWALKIMYKDIKVGSRTARRTDRKSFGLEVINPGNNSNLRKGAVIPVRREITVGRKNDNQLILEDPYASGHHARIYIKNGKDCILEDLESTNGTLLNGKKLRGKHYLNSGDEVRIGNTSFKVIG